MTNLITHKNTRKIFVSSILFSIISLANLMVDNLLIGHLGEPSINGMGIVTSVSPLILAFLSGGEILFLKNMNKYNKSREAEKVRATFSFAYLYQIFIVIFLAIMIFSLKEIMIDKRLGNNWEAISEANKVYVLATISAIIVGSSYIFNWLFYVNNKNLLLTSFSVFGITINVITSSILIFGLGFGVLGGAIGTILSVTLILFLKISYLLWNKNTRNLILPIKGFSKLLKYKDVFRKWFAIPYEISYFFTAYLFYYLLNIYFFDGLTVYNIFSPFMYFVVGTVGMEQIYIKYNNEIDLDSNARKKILKISWIRINIVALFVIAIFSFMILGTNIYNIDYDTKIDSLIIFSLSTLSLSLTSPLYNIAFNTALFDKKFVFYFYDIFVRVSCISILIIIGIFFNYKIMFFIVIVGFQLLQSIFPFLLYKPFKDHEFN